MVQSIGNVTPQKYGSIDRIGTKENGRVVYQITDTNGKVSGKMSVAAKDCDVFEKSYSEMMIAAPKMQKYIENSTPEKIEKKQKLGKWIIGISTALGGGIPLIFAKGGTWKQIGLTALGTIGGLALGFFASLKLTTPPGAIEMSKATQTISKLDIQPEV